MEINDMNIYLAERGIRVDMAAFIEKCRTLPDLR